MPRRIFAADDWGFSPGINAGILKLAQLGQLRNVSLIANSAYLSHRLDELIAYAKHGLEFSLHFNLTHGKPLSKRSPSLLAKDGNFHSHIKLLLLSALGRITEEDLRREFDLQLEMLRRIAVPVTGVDGHHHVHLIPGLSSAIQKFAAESGIQRFRLMVDRAHLPSRLQTWLSPSARTDLKYEACYYLRPRDLKSSFKFSSKTGLGHTLLVHPALYDDFAEAGMTDSLRAGRVIELQKILEFSGEMNA